MDTVINAATRLKASSSDARLENLIKLVADSVQKLRKQDVYRLLEENLTDAQALADYICSKRPDLDDEVNESLEELINS